MQRLSTNPLKRPFALRFPFVVLLLSFLSACAATRPKPPDWQGYGPEEAVRKRIEHDPRLEGLRIFASFSEGTATVTGEVDSLGQKDVAEEGLYEVAGVHTVVNNLTVKVSAINVALPANGPGRATDHGRDESSWEPLFYIIPPIPPRGPYVSCIWESIS